MKYLVRINPRAVNPITKQLITKKLFEVEQCATKDSGQVVWHCAAVCVGDKVLLPQDLLKPQEYHGFVVRGQDNSIVIYEGRHDVV